MFPEQREALDEIIVKMRSGRMTRRTFLERALAVGLTSSAAVSLLEACGSGGGGTSSGPTTVVWQTENDNSGTYPAIVDAFNSSQKDVHVIWHNGPSNTSGLITQYDTALRARSATFDVFNIDVVWPAQFASNGWTVDLTSRWPASERANYLQGPIKSCTYNGQVVAAPMRTDLGVLYYRTDIISTPPKTFNDLVSMSKANSPSKAQYGFAWQGAQYEGVVCDFVEVLGGYGGSVLDPNNSKSVTVNSAEGQQALTEMVSWVGTISPISITTYMEETCRLAFQNGTFIFMRNWPYAYSLGNASGSKVAGKFDITSLPYGGSSTTGHSCTGGWNMAINAFTKNADAAWTFMHYVLGESAQKTLAIKGSFTPALNSVYSDADVQKAQPLFTKLAPILQNALPRPVSPVYTDLSNIIQTQLHLALTKSITPQAALSAMASQLQTLVNK